MYIVQLDRELLEINNYLKNSVSFVIYVYMNFGRNLHCLTAH